MRSRCLLACLFLCTLAPASASVSMRLNTAGVITAPTELSVDGVIAPGGYQAICAALVSLQYDPTKLAITSVRAGTGWTNEGTNDITENSVYLTLLTNIPAMQWSTGPMVYVTVSPVNGPVDTDDCEVLSIWGGGMDVDSASHLATETYDTVYVTGGCGGGEAMEEEGSGDTDGIPIVTSGESLDSLCDPDTTGALAALQIAGGLVAATPADVLLYDLDVDGRVTLLDAVAVLQACPHVADRRYFYVAPNGDDDNPGTDALPWRTLARAMRTDPDPGVTQLQPGDTLLVREGETAFVEAVRPDPFLQWNPEKEIYERKTPSLAVTPGEPDARITMRAYPGERPEVHGVFWPLEPSYWTFSGINVKWPTPGENVAIIEGDPTTEDDDEPLRDARDDDHMVKITGGEGWVFQHAEISDARSFAGMLVAASASGPPTDWVVRSNVIHDTLATNATNQDHLLYINTGLSESDTYTGLVERNILYNHDPEGIEQPNGSGIKLGPDAYLDTSLGTAHVVVRYNTIYNTKKAIIIGGGSKHNLIYRNLFVWSTQNGNSVGHLQAFYLNYPGEKPNTVSENIGYQAPRITSMCYVYPTATDPHEPWDHEFMGVTEVSNVFYPCDREHLDLCETPDWLYPNSFGFIPGFEIEEDTEASFYGAHAPEETQ